MTFGGIEAGGSKFVCAISGPDGRILIRGTGIGGGAVIHGRPLHGLVHPEMGHLRIRRAAGDAFPGCCPAHADCFEGLASGKAIAERWGAPAHELSQNHPAWQLETHYVALGLADIIVTLSP